MSTVLIENIVTQQCLDDALAALQATCCQPLPTSADSGAGSIPVAGPLVISGAGNITTSASGNTFTVTGASSALIDNGDGTYSFMPGDGGAPTEVLTSTLVANADGSYTFTGADGSTVDIPADCCPTMVDNGDGTYTFTAGDGSITTITVHPAAAVTNNAAPFAWDATTQVLNVPQAPTLVANGDGSHTFTAGDGSAPVIIPADCCPTLVANGDGSFTFTAGDGSTVIIPALPIDIRLANAVIDTATNEMVLTLNDGTEYRVPLSALLPVVSDGATVVGDGTVGNPLSAGYLADNGNGTYTWNGAGGSGFTIPADCCPTLTDNGDGTYTFTAGDGSTTTITVHPAAAVTNNAAPFAWNAATQVLNVPQAPTLVANGDGSHTFTAGDGSAPVIIPADCCPTLVDNGDGTYTFTAGNGGTTTITVHPAATLTSSSAPFAWNGATQTGNIPQSPALTLTASGFTFTAGDGSAAVNYVEPVDNDTYVTAFSIVGNTATITMNSGTTFTQTIPTTIDINVQSFALAGTDLVLTETDGTVHTVALPQEIKVSAVGYVAATGILTVTNSDGTSVTTSIPTHPAATVTNNASPFAWDATTQVLNVPQAPTLVANGDGSHTFTAGDGSAPVTIPADCCPTLVANADGSFTFTAGDGSTVVIPALPLDVQLANAVIDTATNELVLTLNDGTEYRVPLSALLPVVSDGVTVVGDGTVGDPLSAGYLADNGNGTYTWNGADGSTVVIPAELPLVANDSTTVDFTTSGASDHTVTADVKVSATAGNALVVNADGLYVENDTPLTANDSATIDFTTSGADNHTVTATVKVSAATCNGIRVNADGLWAQLDNGSYVRVVTNLPNVTRVDADLAAIPIQTPTEIDNVTMTFNNPQCYPVVVYGMYRSGNIYMQAGPGNSWETQIGPTTNPSECASRWGVSVGEPAEDFGISSIRFPYILDVPAGGSTSITFTRRLNIIEYTPNAINRIIWGVGNSYHIVTR